jgi:hypothetical protein
MIITILFKLHCPWLLLLQASTVVSKLQYNISTFYNRILCEKVVNLVLHSTLRYHVSLSPSVLLTLPDLLFFCNGILWFCCQNSTLSIAD